MKHAVNGLLLALLLTPNGARAETIPLVDGFEARIDEGRLRLEVGDRVPLEFSLEWFDATESRTRSLVPGDRVQGAELHVESHHWPWFHVAPIAFLDAELLADEGVELTGAVGLHLATESPWRKSTAEVQPHLAIGKAPRVDVEIFETIVELDDYDRRHVGIVRLDRHRAIVREDGNHLLWEAGTEPNWPLAVIVARSRASLEFLAGLAVVTYDDAGRAKTPQWKAPPMCGRCRSPRLEELRMDVRLDRRHLRLEVELRSAETIHPIAWSALRIDDIPMNIFFRGREDRHAIYEIPVENPAALRIAKAIDSGTIDTEVFLHAGPGHEPESTFVMATPGLAERVESYAPIDFQEEIPSYLSPRLVQSWPNPFRDATTIEVEVPATLREAFDLDANLRNRIDPHLAPPFGPTPNVRVRVFNVSGKLVKLIDDQVREPGRFVVHWDGSDVQGRPVAAGAYYVNVEMGDWSVTRRVLRIRD